MSDAQRARWAWRLTVGGFVIAVLGLPPVLLWYHGVFEPDSHPPKLQAIMCPRVFDKAHSVLERESGNPAPPTPGIAFTPSMDLPGRVDLTLTWINAVPVSKTAVAIQGVYGRANSTDYFIDHTEPAAATGDCWNWYHYTTRDDAQPLKVYTRVDGLWPGQKYCLYTAYRTDAGYSKPSPIFCRTAPWKSAWGKPAQAPRR